MTASGARRVGRVLALAGLVIVGGVVLRTDPDEPTSGIAARARAPRFAAVTLDSVPVQRTLDDYAGQPLIINLWATWCDPCREEMPGFERLYRDYKGRGLRIVAISADDGGSKDLIREFVKEHRLTFDVLHDQSGDVLTQFRARGIPETFLISRTGEIVGRRFVADWSSPASRALVDSLLALTP